LQTLTLYHRPGCHLCSDMRAELLELQDELDFRLLEIDIDPDTELRTRFCLLIPVLCLGEQEICHYHLNPAALRVALARPSEAG
jgi:glutathione S-transferase